MAQALVCSANGEYRSVCDVACEACRFLIGDRRARAAAGRVQWTMPERRVIANLLPSRLKLAGEGGDTYAIDGEPISAAWQLLALLVSFNILDCILTARALSLGYAEANPVMAALFEINLPLGMFAKTLFVGTGAFFLWRFRHLGIAARGLSVLTFIYGTLVLYHLSFQLLA